MLDIYIYINLRRSIFLTRLVGTKSSRFSMCLMAISLPISLAEATKYRWSSIDFPLCTIYESQCNSIDQWFLYYQPFLTIIPIFEASTWFTYKYQRCFPWNHHGKSPWCSASMTPSGARGHRWGWGATSVLLGATISDIVFLKASIINHHGDYIPYYPNIHGDVWLYTIHVGVLPR